MSNREFFSHCLTSEIDRFVNVLQAVPDGRLDWRPDPKSRTAGELVGHLLGHQQDIVELLEAGDIHHRLHAPFRDIADAASQFQAACEAAATQLASMDDASWDGRPGKFLVGEQVIMEAPRANLGWMLLFDAIHHRGQLSTYLRPMGSKVPSIYGPSADTRMEH